MSTNTQVATTQQSAFSSMQAFEDAQRMAGLLSKSTVVPKEFQGNVSNCVIALEYANRIGESPIVLMQNLNIISGRPGLKSEYLAHRINTLGKFTTPLEFHYEGQGETLSCYAYATKADGKIAKGNPVSIKMARAEGWYTRSGSKWPNMPEQMLAYRATSFFARLHCPEANFGLQTADEIIDTSYTEVKETPSAIDAVNAKIQANKKQAAPVTPIVTPPKREPMNVTLTDDKDKIEDAQIVSETKLNNEDII